MSITDEQIAAYADGELYGAELAMVEAAIAADPAVARKIEAHRALKSKLGGHFAPILDQPVPDHLAAMLAPKSDRAESAEVVSFATERRKRGLAPALRRWAPFAGPALAASLVLAVIQPWNTASPPGGYADGQLAAALNNQLVATQQASGETRILVSFANADGEFCRAYRTGEVGGIACRDETGWDIDREFALDGAQTTQFRQAGSEADVLRAVQDMADGDALNAEEEAAAKDRDWR